MSTSDELSALRRQLSDVDRQLVELIATRQRVVERVGQLKLHEGLRTRDYAQEKDVIQRARTAAQRLDLQPELAERVMLLLIQSSLALQEQRRVQAVAGGSGRRVLVIGGAGKMGRWFVRFLASQGFAVHVADPAGPVGGYPHVADYRELDLDHDVIVVASPLRSSRAILAELAVRKPRGVVFDIGSLKTPLRESLVALVRAGVRATSIHPMFGPDTELLSGRHVIFVDLGAPEATRAAREIFDSTMAIQVDMDLEVHDRLIAYILGLSHVLNIAFFTALNDSGEPAKRLAQLSSTTFDAQLAVAARVAHDNPHLYFEIQSLNDYGKESLSALLRAVERVLSAVERGDEESFVTMMQNGRRYLGERDRGDDRLRGAP